MRKFAIIAVALALGTASSVALADGGNFFVNANAGASHYNVENPYSGIEGNSFSKTGKAGALRVGYRWNSVVDYGVEAGYGFLGNAVAREAPGPRPARNPPDAYRRRPPRSPPACPGRCTPRCRTAATLP